MAPSPTDDFSLEKRNCHWAGLFNAMASPCEVLVCAVDRDQAHRLTTIAHGEARRIEMKFSRYRDDNIIHGINSAAGQAVIVDDETARLLDLADRCHELSDGRFDITSGVLRRVWHFDGGDRLPSRGQVKSLLPMIGWQRVQWRRPELILPAGMEIDLGGLGKEYAVDRVAAILTAETHAGLLVNFGGDLRVSGDRPDGGPWEIGVEDPSAGNRARRVIHITAGGLATSGDARRYLLRDGRRYSHVLNPRTGWPVKDAPRSITVAAGTCLEAGMLATLAMLRGRQAEAFLTDQKIDFWCER